MSNKIVGFVYQLPLVILCALVVAPVLILLKSWFLVDSSLWQHLWQTQLVELVANTLILFFGVGIGVSVIGVPLAWLTAVCDFPGRRFFDWALILPLAIPSYVLAFITLGIYDFGGTVQAALRYLGYTKYIDVRHPLMVVWVMTAVLYPYVYLLVRAAFLNQGAELLNMARTLGRRPMRAFFEAALPAIRPALVAGIALALMETLADFGTVSIFGFNTFTTAIYKSWFSLFSLHTAAQLATLLLLFVMICLLSERVSRKGLIGKGRSSATSRQRVQLSGKWKYAAVIFCALILLLTLVLPFIQLSIWAYMHVGVVLNSGFFNLVLHTFALGLMAALIVVCFAIAISVNQLNQANRNKPGWSTELTGMGYALPGSVLAIGVMLCLSLLDSAYVKLGGMLGLSWQPVMLGSLAGLLIAYVIRFFRPGYGSVQSGFDAVHSNYVESAELMGISRWQRFTRITLPLILPGVLTGGLIVFVDVIKEMPATLLLRPFGWDTLAVKLYELTSEGEWERAAIPAITLVLVSSLPVIMLIRQSRFNYSQGL